MAYTTINKSSDYFNTKLYTGNASTNAITGVGFQPDWTWIKGRGTTNAHMLFDAVRGVGEAINSNNGNAEATVSTAFTAFDSDGFTVGNYSETNTNSENYVSWNWKAGTGQGSSNTDGSINTTYTSANTTSGFSIVKWTGTGANATVGHGLGVAPKMIIVKNLATTDSWNVYHESIGNGKRLFLDTTGAESSTSDAWNSTSPTTSVFSIGTNTGTNNSGSDLIAYCFAEKTGFSKFGSYTGNGNADGTFVYTGFKPAFVLQKRSSSTESWQITDHARDANVSPNFARLMPNLSNVENTNTTWAKIEKFSNGFKLGGTDTVSNGSGSTYIYMAFAEAPLVGSNNVPCTAR